MDRLDLTLEKIGRSVGRVVDTSHEAGRGTVDVMIRTVLPCIAFVALSVGIVTGTDTGDLLGIDVRVAR